MSMSFALLMLAESAGQHPSSIYLSMHILYMPVYASADLSIYLSVYLSIRLFVYPFAYLPIYLSIYLPTIYLTN